MSVLLTTRRDECPDLYRHSGQPEPISPAAPWHILHTKSRREKALASDLEAMGVPHFLPLATTVTYQRQRKITTQTPLFAGYVFLQGTLDQVYLADRTRHVASIIRVFDQARLTQELDDLRHALSAEAPLMACPFLKVGLWVEIIAGPFQGIRGLIEQVSKRARVMLQIQSVGQATCLEIDGSLLEPIDPPTPHRAEPAWPVVVRA